MAPENNSDPNQVSTPRSYDDIIPQTPDSATVTPQPVSLPTPAESDSLPVNVTPAATPSVAPVDPMPYTPSAPPPPENVLDPTLVSTAPPSVPPKKTRRSFKTKLIVLAVLILLGAVGTGAYFMGKHNERIVYRAPLPQPINLPPQAVVTNNCVPGRGKQYIIPKDIPAGPIYDVENSKVIAIEYNLDLSSIESNPDTLSGTLLTLTKLYTVNHFSIVPVTPKAGTGLQNIHLIMFVVSKAEANSITCSPASTS